MNANLDCLFVWTLRRLSCIVQNGATRTTATNGQPAI